MYKYTDPIIQLEYLQDNTPPSFAYKEGEDIELWKVRARKKLEELTGLDKFKKVADDQFMIENIEERDDYIRYRFNLLVEEKSTSVGYLLLPHNMPSIPMVICLQGHSNGMHISIGKAKVPEEIETIKGGRDLAIQAINQGFAALVIEQRDFGERKRHPEELGVDCHVPTMYELMLGRTTIASRVWDISRTLDAILRNFKQIDSDKIYITGNSGGGTVSYYTACLEDRIAASMPSCSVCTYRGSIATIWHCVCNHIPSILQYFEMADLALLIAPKPIVIICGKDDINFPLESVKEAFLRIKELYRYAGAEDRCTLVIGNEGHRFYPEEGWAAFNKLTKE